MVESINNIVGILNGPIWGVGMLVLIVGGGLYMTIGLKGFQFVHFKDMWSRILDKGDSDAGISAFASFCTTMAMRVGTGNVAGVAVALYMDDSCRYDQLSDLFRRVYAGRTLQDPYRRTVSRRRRVLRRERSRLEVVWHIFCYYLWYRRFLLHAGSRYIHHL